MYLCNKEQKKSSNQKRKKYYIKEINNFYDRIFYVAD